MIGNIVVDQTLLAAIGTSALALALVISRVYLTRDLIAVRRAWKGIFPLLQERRRLVKQLSAQMRGLLGSLAVVDDIDFVLSKASDSDDANRHAAVQNGLIMTVQKALDEFHRNRSLHDAPDLFATIEAIGVVDSRIAPRRNHHNALVQRHNDRLDMQPFIIMASFLGVRREVDFPMLIPWWSTDEGCYSGDKSERIRHMWEMYEDTPVIVPPTMQVDQVKEVAGYGVAGLSRGAVRAA
jgi:hypothetical protein